METWKVAGKEVKDGENPPSDKKSEGRATFEVNEHGDMWRGGTPILFAPKNAIERARHLTVNRGATCTDDFARAIMGGLLNALEEATAPRPSLAATDKAEKDEAYRQRNVLVSALARIYPSGVRRTAIEGWSEDWHGCVYIDLPAGQVSYHYHDSQAHLFIGLPAYTKEWDGHDKATAEQRLWESICTPPSHTATRAEGGDWIDSVVLDICEIPDRTSPEDEPEIMLVKASELRRIIDEHAPRSAIEPTAMQKLFGAVVVELLQEHYMEARDLVLGCKVEIDSRDGVPLVRALRRADDGNHG